MGIWKSSLEIIVTRKLLSAFVNAVTKVEPGAKNGIKSENCHENSEANETPPDIRCPEHLFQMHLEHGGYMDTRRCLNGPLAAKNLPSERLFGQHCPNKSMLAIPRKMKLMIDPVDNTTLHGFSSPKL